MALWAALPNCSLNQTNHEQITKNSPDTHYKTHTPTYYLHPLDRGLDNVVTHSAALLSLYFNVGCPLCETAPLLLKLS